MDSPAKIRILIVEDHTLLRESLARSLGEERDIEIAGQCAGVSEALQLIETKSIDVVLLDLNLGVEQGGAFLNTCWQGSFRGHVLVVTAGVGEREAAWLIRRGCEGIFLKHKPLEELVARIRAVMTGKPIQDEFLKNAGLPLDSTDKEQLLGKALTAREKEVLRLVCEGLASKEIAVRLNVSESSVKSFIQQLFNKTGVRTRAQLVRIAIEEYWDELGAE